MIRTTVTSMAVAVVLCFSCSPSMSAQSTIPPYCPECHSHCSVDSIEQQVPLYPEVVGPAIEMFGEWLEHYGIVLGPDIGAIPAGLGQLVRIGGLLYGELPGEITLYEDWTTLGTVSCPDTCCANKTLLLRVSLFADYQIRVGSRASGLSRVLSTPIATSFLVKDSASKHVWGTLDSLSAVSPDTNHRRCQIRATLTARKPSAGEVLLGELGKAAVESFHISGGALTEITANLLISDMGGGCAAEFSFDESPVSLVIEEWHALTQSSVDLVEILYPGNTYLTFVGSGGTENHALAFTATCDDPSISIVPKAPIYLEDGRIRQKFKVAATNSSALSTISSLVIRLTDPYSGHFIERRLTLTTTQQHPPVAQATQVAVTRQDLRASNGDILKQLTLICQETTIVKGFSSSYWRACPDRSSTTRTGRSRSSQV